MKLNHFYKTEDGAVVFIEHFENGWVRAIDVRRRNYIVTRCPAWIELNEDEAAMAILLW